MDQYMRLLTLSDEEFAAWFHDFCVYLGTIQSGPVYGTPLHVTLQETLAMNDRELDIQIARLLGWTGITLVHPIANAILGESGSKAWVGIPPENVFYSVIPNWQADYDLAMSLLENYLLPGMKVDLQNPGHTRQWLVTLHGQPERVKWSREGDWLSVAICEAFVAWKQSLLTDAADVTWRPPSGDDLKPLF